MAAPPIDINGGCIPSWSDQFDRRARAYRQERGAALPERALTKLHPPARNALHDAIKEYGSSAQCARASVTGLLNRNDFWLARACARRSRARVHALEVDQSIGESSDTYSVDLWNELGKEIRSRGSPSPAPYWVIEAYLVGGRPVPTSNHYARRSSARRTVVSLVGIKAIRAVILVRDLHDGRRTKLHDSGRSASGASTIFTFAIASCSLVFRAGRGRPQPGATPSHLRHGRIVVGANVVMEHAIGVVSSGRDTR